MKEHEAKVRTVKSNTLEDFDKVCQHLVNQGWQPDSDLQVNNMDDGFMYHRTFIWIPVASMEEEGTKDLT